VELQKVIAEVDLRALSHNLRVVKKKTGGKDIMAVVKANAYGHGALEISKHLIKKGTQKLGVAFTEEAIALRESGIDIPITVFFDRDNIDECIRYKLTPTVFELSSARKLDAKARKLNRKIPVHIKVDTGMGRIGFTLDSALKEIAAIASLKNVEPEGLMSHFSDADLKDKKFANLQLKNFRSLIRSLEEKKITFKHHHMANSAAVLSMPDAHLDMVRPGIMLYGYGYHGVRGLKPVLSLKSNILLLKTVPMGTPISYGRTFITKRRSTIATIPLGYADGYSRKLSNKGEVLIKGKRAPVVGRVCMDTIMVDVTDIPDVNYKNKAVIIGSQGKEKITAEEIADKTGTIPYEVLTSIGQRVKRVYRT
jgi:alanine racemase